MVTKSITASVQAKCITLYLVLNLRPHTRGASWYREVIRSEVTARADKSAEGLSFPWQFGYDFEDNDFHENGSYRIPPLFKTKLNRKLR